MGLDIAKFQGSLKPQKDRNGLSSEGGCYLHRYWSHRHLQAPVFLTNWTACQYSKKEDNKIQGGMIVAWQGMCSTNDGEWSRTFVTSEEEGI